MHSRPSAKVNLSLTVSEVRPDGFHDLQSIFLRVGLCDDLIVAFGDRRGNDELIVSGLPGVPTKGNLVLRAFEAVRRALRFDPPPLVAHLDKRIPMQAGLAGGSSDAAAAIDAALQMWGVGLAPEAVDRIALDLGSDVPFFVRGGRAAEIGGRGDAVTATSPPRDLGLLLVTPTIALSTARVFARFDELERSPQPPTIAHDVLDRLPGAATELRDANGLWPAAVSLAPELGALRDDLERATERPWLMSGSGSTLFALYPSVAEAVGAGQALAEAPPPSLAGALGHAVDLVGPDPSWRHQWLSEQ